MSHEPIAYCDADFANQLSNRRSTTGRVIMLYGAAVIWSSRQQRTVAMSTSEAEYYALGDVGRDIVWVRRLLSDLGSPLTRPTPAREDNRSAMKWATDAASWSKTRHIDVQYHKVREWISAGAMRVEHCPTSAQIADICTKALPADTHRRLKMDILGEAYKFYPKYHNPPATPAAA